MSLADWIFVGTAYALGINLASYITFASDKHYAVKGMRRVPERTLLKLAVFGGTVGIIIGQKLLRHKTRKEPFRTELFLISALQVITLAVVGFWQISEII
jgi:uncharacterized membrane protein YsdA (DUF1294 family)